MNEIKNTIKNFLWVYKPLNRKCKLTLFVALLMILVGAFIPSLIPKYIGNIIDNVITDKNLAYTTIGFVAVLFLFDILAEIGRRYLIEKTATKEQKELTIKASNWLIHLDINWLNAQRSGGLNARIQRSVEGAIKLLKLVTMDFLPNILQMLFAVCVAFIVNTYIGFVLIIVIFIGLFIVANQIKSQKGIRLSLIRTREDNESNIVELLAGIESVRIANEEENQISRIEVVNETLREREMKHHIKMMFFDSIKKTNIVLWHLVILLIGVALASSSIITPGEIVVFNMLFNNVILPIQSIHRFLDEAHESSLKTSDLKEILNLPIDISYNPDTSNNQIKDNELAICSKNLSVDYGEKRVLENVNVDFEKGKYYGLIGATGCGKSTLLKAIMRLTHPTSGSIHLLGKDINTISRKELSSMIIFMPQKPYIFSGSIKENLLFGCKYNPTDNDLWWALEQASIAEEVRYIENDLNFHLNERGSNLSGGQCQRIALARIFICIKYIQNEHIIILDEATSALDIETEEKVISNLLASVSNKTTIIAIAHRYSTLEKSDCIVNMNNGQMQYISYNDLIIDRKNKTT